MIKKKKQKKCLLFSKDLHSKIDKIIRNYNVITDCNENFNKFLTTALGLISIKQFLYTNSSGSKPQATNSCDSFFLESTDAQGIEKLILELTNEASITAKTLKTVAPFIGNTLELIFNSCIDKGI